MKLARTLIATGAGLLALASQATVTATFDDLVNPPALTGALDLFEANGGSASYQGVVWDSHVQVVGDAYRVDTFTPGPLFGLPHSGDWFVTNQDGIDGLMLTTPLVLTSAWFGQDEYYGYGGGADQVTINALHGTTVLGSVTLDLPDDHPGEPEPLRMMDTSSFLALAGITGYRIDHHSPGPFRDDWIADSFSFEMAGAVPEPSAAGLLALGLGLVAIQAARRTRRLPARQHLHSGPRR